MIGWVKGRDRMVKIEKKGGETEEYTRKKVLLSLIHAGTPPDQAERIAADIESWLGSQGETIVKSSDVRQRIKDILKRINPQAARGYIIYRKSQAAK